MKDFQLPPKTIPRSIGHRAEWIQACKERKPEDAKAGFAYSGPVHRVAAGRQPGRASAEAHRVGRRGHEGHQRPRGRRR